MRRKNTFRYALSIMEIGESKEFPAESYGTVRATASNLGFELNRVYTTATDRARRIVSVTRVS